MASSNSSVIDVHPLFLQNGDNPDFVTLGYDNWTNLPKDLLIYIVKLLTSQEDYYRFSAVCKSWNSAATEEEFRKPWWLPTTTPMLLLAEQVAPGSILYDTHLDINKDYGDLDEDGFTKNDDDDDASLCLGSYDYLKDSVGTSRGLYSLSTMKTYNIDLPQAAGKQIFATSKGWLLTVGRDFQINLLHPLSRYQFSLPPVLTFPLHPDYLQGFDPKYTAIFIQKVAISSRLQKKNTDNFFHHHATPSPVVMAVYESAGLLAFARLGDRVWTKVQVPSDGYCIHDIVYHKGNFYVVNIRGDVFVCCIDSDVGKGGPRGTEIASIRINGEHQNKYLVERLSKSGLWLIERSFVMKYFRKGDDIATKYCTTKFAVWRLDLNYHESPEIPSCTLTEEHNLGNEAIFLGRASSFSVSSSEVIKPNSIYFTDDYWEGYSWKGGGHDMGIFDMEHRTIEPHFQGKSIHCIAPPLWYI
ncbi:hypothetical protein OROHE_027322 [Orobanche hederae]